MQLFYTDTIKDKLAIFDRIESGHMVQSLRKKEGDLIDFTDGQGHHYRGPLISADRRQAQVAIETTVFIAPSEYQMEIAVAPTKQHEKMEWLIEKCVEMGILDFTIMTTQRSERNKIRLDRLQKIALSAMKQSLQFYLPRIILETNFSKVLDKKHKQRFIAACLDEPLPHIAVELKPGTDTLVLIGPEGDFSPDEVGLAMLAGFDKISLGQNRLRTETAAVFAAASFKTINRT